MDIDTLIARLQAVRAAVAADTVVVVNDGDGEYSFPPNAVRVEDGVCVIDLTVNPE